MRIELDTTILASAIRDIPDFPKPGVVFKDITPLLADPVAFSSAVDAIVVSFGRGTIDKVVGIEARGFIVGGALAQSLGIGFAAARKRDKLPGARIGRDYALEYGVDTLEAHFDAVRPGQKVLIHDDLLATGGTARAACHLVEELGGVVVGLGFVVELAFLPGRDALRGYDVASLVTYDSEDMAR
jgi:adenine phosphoribosyltransferase